MSAEKPKLDILVAEGDYGVRALLAEGLPISLPEFDVSVYSTDSGRQALRALSERNFGLALFSGKLTDMSGTEAIAQAKSFYERAGVASGVAPPGFILCTALPEEHYSSAKTLGVPILNKPFDLKEAVEFMKPYFSAGGKA